MTRPTITAAMRLPEDACDCDYGEGRQCRYHADERWREIDCEVCDGGGGHWLPGRYVDVFYPCRACNGTGRVTVEVQPIAMEDLDNG